MEGWRGRAVAAHGSAASSSAPLSPSMFGAGAGVEGRFHPSLPDTSLTTIGQMSMLASQAHEVAQARLTAAKEARSRGIYMFKSEMTQYKDADMPARLQRWMQEIAVYDAELSNAEITLKEAETNVARLKEAKSLHLKHTQAQSSVHRCTKALEMARLKYEESVFEADAAANAARLAEAQVLDGPIGSRVSQLAMSGQQTRTHDQMMGDPNDDIWSNLLTAPEEAVSQTLVEQLDSASLREVCGPSGRTYGGTSLCLMVREEPRRSAILLLESPPFDPIILVIIGFNCFTMAWESPLDPPGTQKAAFIAVCEWAFLGVFSAELLIKLLAYSFFKHRSAYFRDPWCVLDFTVVALGWLPMIVPSAAHFNSLRAFRALRPLRALKRIPGMPHLVQWVLDVLPKMGNVAMLCGFILLIFGVVGMELFKGSLHYRCALPGFNPEMNAMDEEAFDTGIACHAELPGFCLGTINTTCQYFEANPHHGTMTFDSVPLALIALAEALTFDDWSAPMYALMSSVSPQVWIYFVSAVLLGGFFIVNFFLAVIYLEYGSSGDRIASDVTHAAKTQDATEVEKRQLLAPDALLSDGARTGDVAAHAHAGWCDCSPAEGSCREALAVIMSSGFVSAVATCLVLLNVLLMCMPYEGMSTDYALKLEQCASIITWTFIAEMGLKLLAFGCVEYWADRWNGIDGTIVSISIVEMVISMIFAGGGAKLSFLRILRLLRVVRILRLMRSWRGLYEVVAVFIRAMPNMVNIIILITIFMFIFSIVGMQVFGGIYSPTSGYSLHPCLGGACLHGLKEKPLYHFDYFVPSMLTTFVLLTGEWVEAMKPAAGTLGPVVNLFFFPVVAFGKYFLLNLLVSVVLTEFSRNEGGPITTRESVLQRGSQLGFSELDRIHGTSPRERWPCDYTCGCIGPRSSMRKYCHAITSSQMFSYVVIAAIIISCVCLTLDTPRLDPNSQLYSDLRTLDYCFTAFFFVEMCLKVGALGFLVGEDAYLKSAWNQIDFVIVFSSVLDLLAGSIDELQSLRFLRTLRVLRPLRLVSRNAGMKLIITSLFKALPGVTNVLGVVLTLQVVFAILGMQLFSGVMASCDDPSAVTEVECNSRSEDLQIRTGRVLRWSNPAVGSFDNFGEAMRLLYVMSSGDNWAVLMHRLMGATEHGRAPVRNDFSPAAAYSIAWMCVGFIFAINLFVGVVVDNFTRMQHEMDGSATMTKEQQQWVSTVKAMMTRLPTKAMRLPRNPLQLFVYRLIVSRPFDMFITCVVVANMGAMACDYWGIEADTLASQAYALAMLAFVCIYYIECILKMIGLGLAGYFGDAWNQFDFFLVCSSLLDLFATGTLASYIPLPPMILRILRVFRVLRILRLLKNAKGLRDLLVTMVLSIPSLLNVSSLLALHIYVYSVLGVQLFTFLALGEVRDNGSGGINDVRNFKNIWTTALLLFQCLTGDGWSDLMADAMMDEYSGQCGNSSGNCGSVIAIPYFISFQILGSFVFLNLVVAVILENFSTLHNVNPNLVSASDLEMFAEVWAEFDPDATNYIPMSELPSLLLRVPRPLGLKGRSHRQAVRLCMRLDLSQHEGGLIAYNELVVQLVENNYFRSGADATDERAFKKVAVPWVKGRPLNDVPVLELRREQNPLLAHSSTVALGYARKVVGEAMKDWRRRIRVKKWRQAMERDDLAARSAESGGFVPFGVQPSGLKASGQTLKDELALGGVAGVFSHLLGLPEMPPSMIVTGGVSRLGWLRCNGQKRWIKIGDDFLEVWLSHSAIAAEQRYVWSQWGMKQADLDLHRAEPAILITLATYDRSSVVTLLLQAYEKESEPTQIDRQAHLLGFLEVLKLHLLEDAKINEVEQSFVLRGEEPLNALMDIQVAHRRKSPSRRLTFGRRLGTSRDRAHKDRTPQSGSPSWQRILPHSPFTKNGSALSLGARRPPQVNRCVVNECMTQPAPVGNSLGLGSSCPPPQVQFSNNRFEYV